MLWRAVGFITHNERIGGEHVVGYEPNSASKHIALPVTSVNEATIPGEPEEILDDAALTKGHADRAKRRAKAKGIHVTFR